MKERVYNFDLQLSWKLLQVTRQLDRFDASWTSMEKLEDASLKQLKHFATIQSIGASTRIEGSTLNNAAVETLLEKIDISKIEDRDSQEVVGYFNVLDLISEAYEDIDIQDTAIKNLHNILLKYSKKDEWHRGDYKQLSNAVQATFPDGTQQVVFRTTEPGFATEAAMQSLIAWFNMETQVHPLIACAAFVYDFLSIHPFQDGNGRLSRLLTTLILLRSGYKWIEYVSFEHEIENRKKEYYRALRNCQAQRPDEDITEWVVFFLESLVNVQEKLQRKLDENHVTEIALSPKEKEILQFISEQEGCKSGEIVEALQIPKPTVKRIIKALLEKNLIEKHGRAAGTNYSRKT